MVRVAASRSHSTNLETYLIWLSFVPYAIYQAHYVLPPHLCYLQTEAETLHLDITVQFLCFTGLVRWEWRLRTGKFSSFIQYVFVWLFSSYSVPHNRDPCLHCCKLCELCMSFGAFRPGQARALPGKILVNCADCFA